MDAVFKALADPTRRSLLDELFEEDGQTLSALEQRLPMTRFGVMKHLKVLEEAGLAIVERLGLGDYRYLHATRGELLRRLGRAGEARAAYQRALELSGDGAERRLLERRIETLDVPT